MSGFAYAVGEGTVRAVEIGEACHIHGGFVWVHLNEGSDHARHWLTDIAQLPQIAVDALTAVETRPRCDAIGEAAVVNLRGLSSNPMAMSDPLASVRVYAAAGRIISVTRNPVKAVDAVVAAVASGRVADPGDLIHELANAITETLDPTVAAIGDELDDCEAMLEGSKAFELRRTVSRVRAEAIGYRRFLGPQRAALEKLASLDLPWLSDDDRLHLAASADRAARMAEELEAIRERAGLMHETLTDLRTELIDERSLIIAVVAFVFLPLTFLTGLLGMNVDGIPYAREPWAFWGVVGVCVVIALAITAVFVRRHWLR